MNELDRPPTPSAGKKTFGRRKLAALAAALGGLTLLTIKSQAQGLGGWGRGRSRDPEEVARRLDYRIGYMIKELGGTPEQKDKLVAIARQAMADLKPVREQLRQTRRQGLELLAAPTIDKAALEQLRSTQMQAADALSRRLLQSMIDSAEVLKPEQRSALAAKMKQRMERHQRR
jgi:Spy/CpxP family protein refolding chaperone